MSKYRKKSPIFDAMQYNGSNIEEIALTLGIYEIQQEILSDFITIPTLKGNIIVNKLDYIIKGIEGEFFPCDPVFFEEMYEEVLV